MRVFVDGARSADPPISHGTFFATALSTLLDDSRLATPFASAGKVGQVAVPALRQLAALHALDVVGEIGELLLVGAEALLPRLAQLRAARADAGFEVLVHAVGDEELGVRRPAVALLGQADLVFAQRLAVRGAGVLLVRRAPADVAVDDDQRRPIVGGLEDVERAAEQIEIVGVADARDVPAVADEARRDVIAVGEGGVALDGDVVVVVDPAQVRQLQVAGDRARLRC